MSQSPETTDRTLQRGLAKAIARSWRDDGYRQRLTDDPVAALSEIGVTVPDTITLNIVPDGTALIPLPAASDPGDEAAAEAAARLAYEALYGSAG